MLPGKLIVIEGLDGSGKSTQTQLLVKNLNNAGFKSFLSIKPTHYLIGGLIRSRLTGDWSCSSECLQSLFLADHLFSLEKEIIPKLEKGINVISDRYFYSTYAYGVLDCDKEWIINMNKALPEPDLIYFLDLPIDICLKRIEKERISKELYEKKEILEKVRKNYFDSFKLVKNAYLEIFDANISIKELEKKLKNKTVTNIYNNSNLFDMYSDCPDISISGL